MDDVTHIAERTVGLIEEVVEALSNTTETMQNHGWEINPKKMQRAATEVKFGMIIWQELCRIVCLADSGIILLYGSQIETLKSIGLWGFQRHNIFGTDIKIII